MNKVEVKISNLSEIRMGSPFNTCDIQLIGINDLHLPKSGWQDKFAFTEDSKQLILIKWNFPNNEPGFILYSIDIENQSYQVSGQLLGLPKTVSINNEGRVLISKFYFDKTKTKDQNYANDVTEEYIFS
jgi:hypothetical protein